MGVFGNAEKLGFGLMRLPLLNPEDTTSIDTETTKKMVDEFISRGFTYFDTAIMYHGTKSQEAVKEVLTSRYPRDSYTIATKLHWDYFNSKEDIENIFSDQLAKMGVDYFDYYLIHAINRENYVKYEKFDCFKWLADKKARGLVKHIGFSFHDKADFLDKILTEHPETEFVQLQINYLDWESDRVESRKNYEVCVKHGKEVIVMEPVKGGALASPPEVVKEMFKNRSPEMSPASWAVRFAASHENVKIVLSGMSNPQQMLDNLSYMENFKPLDNDEIRMVLNAAKAINDSLSVACTSCEYCVGGCPMNIAIPKYFALYNSGVSENSRKEYKELCKKFGAPSDCIECGQCENACPQKLPVISHIKAMSELFEK